jgi:hypothetical protein
MTDKSEHDYIQWVLKVIIETNEMMGKLNKAMIEILTVGNQNLISTIDQLNKKIEYLNADLYWQKHKSEKKDTTTEPLPAEPF